MRYVWDKVQETWVPESENRERLLIAVGSAGWPMASDSAGVHPSQVPEALEEAKRLGVRVEFKKDGSPIFDSEAHRRRYCKAIGLHDRNCFNW